ncbi:MAG TPA: non-ribosomal peptide synthetase [Pyrinomonadaceae bacterium]|nr:non-ribosomal peptide synthetase [Pyrinomonadaceae bacterium]
MATKSVIHSVFEEVAEGRADSLAVSDAGGSVTYGELNRAANRVAFNLRERYGVGRGAVVGLYLPAGINYVVGLLGVAKAGGVFLPLEPGTPALRQRMFLEKAKPALVVADAAHDRSFLELEIDVPLLRLEELSEGPATNPPLEVDGDDASYIVFTSGSTGEPKAILGSQKGLSHFVHWEVKEFGLDQTARVSQLAPTTFDVSLRDIFAPLLAGGTLCIPTADARADSRQLLEWLDAEAVTLVHCVPSLFRGLLQELAERPRPDALLRSLRHVLLAGEPLYVLDVQRWRALFGERVELVNLYGPSETTLAKAFQRIREVPPEPGRMIPVGRPLPNTALLVIKDGQLCDPGERGEIGEVFIKTPFMSKGYYGDPQLTAETFVQNPLNPNVPDIIYRTGDQGRYLSDMSVELLGRLDNQVKVRGIRIELGEIERALLRHPSVVQAVVVGLGHEDRRLGGLKHEDRQIYLTAYFIASEPLDDAGLREHLRHWLPEAMHPAFFVQLESFPLNLHGKVNRRALPSPVALLYRNRPCEPPADKTEEAVAELWGEVLELPQVGVTHSFVELGGDSLRATRLPGRILMRFGVEVTLREILQEGTVRRLAAIINERRPRETPTAGLEEKTSIAPPTAEELRLLAE